MSQRGRGPESPDDDPDGHDAIGGAASADRPLPPAASRPVAPYDPYRAASGDAARPSRRNVAADDAASQVRRPPRTAATDPFLPDDDPLSADAWQLELEELDEPDRDFAATDRPPAPRAARRQPPAARARRESGPAPGRTPRRNRTASGATRQLPVVSLAMPRVVAGSSLVSDQTMLVLLAINAASILVMALLLGVRLGGLPASIVLQLDAAGNPSLWGPPSVLWRLPVMSFFLTAMWGGVAWFLHPVDRFAARFALAAAIVAQLIAWIAVMLHLT